MAVIEPTNLLPLPTASAHPAPARRRVLRRALRIARTIGITLAVVFAVLAWTTRSSNPNIIRALGESATVRTVLSLLRSPSSVLQGEREDRITVLLLGMGGEGHDGPLLTDTIVIASVQPSTRRATLISVPRDLLVPLPDQTSQKVNAINAYAESVGQDGAAAVRDAIARTLGIRIPYHVRVDFRGFSGLIDMIGGVDVAVERTLDDPQYPIAGKESAPWAERFERLLIPPGVQHFDGALALKYVRSRHGRNGEGSDFARARRQQRLLLAVRDKVISWGLLANPRQLLALVETWRTHIHANLSPPEFYRLSAFTAALASDDVQRVVFSDGPGGPLVAGAWSGAYVLRPRDESFEELRAIVRNAFASRTVPDAVSETDPLTVEVWNGTMVNGLAGTTAETLAREGFIVLAVRNAPARSVERSVIYRSARVPDTVVAKLRELLRAEVSTAFPAFASATTPDLLIVLGSTAVTR